MRLAAYTSGDGMHLISIEMENFKSFKGEVIIPFDEGFTAITGPNGSGKSNCGDAIQFVLGPRSAKSLRAQNVKDLIFNGGKNDKPARSCMATLNFANPVMEDGLRRLRVDADVVRFTRTVKLNRKNNAVAGYYLNERPSTSTEFRRLLTEAGARGDGYNIVLQGDVTHLATMTSRERRKVLDDVAGVMAYDDEIKRAERQRANVEEYLERIAILEEELQARLKILTKERVQAMKYRELGIALENAKVTMMHARHRSRFNEIQMIGDERSGYLERIEQFNVTIKEGNAELLELDDQLVAIEKQLDDVIGDDGKALSERMRKLEVDVGTRKDRIADAEQDISDAEDEISVLESEQESAQSALEEHLSGLEAAQVALTKADEDLESAARDEKEAREAISAGDKATHDLNRKFGKTTEAVAAADEARAEAKLEADRAAQKVEMSEERLAELEEALDEARLSRDDLHLVGEDLQVDTPEHDRGSLAEELTRLQKEERTLMDQGEQVEHKLREAERELNRKQLDVENKSGARAVQAQAVSAILSLRDGGEVRGILGPLGELCAPKDGSHDEALAYALGGGMNSIVVRDDEVAASCIKWLRDNRAGRAVFLPLNKLSFRSPGGRARMTERQDGVLGFAFELLEFDESVEAAVRHAVRDTLIVRDMGTARRHMGGVRMVTLDGSVVDASGAMSGGAIRGKRPQFGGNIAGAAAMEQAQTEVSRLEMLADTVDAALAESRKQAMDLRERINNLSDGDHSLKLRGWQDDMKRAQTAFESAENKVKVALTQLTEVKNATEKVRLKSQSFAEQYESAVDNRQKASDALLLSSPKHVSDQLKRCEQVRTDAVSAKIAAEQQLATGNATSELLERNVTDLERRIGEHSVAIEKSQARVSGFSDEIESISVELSEVSEAHAQVAEEHRELDEKRVTLREDRASLRASLENHSAQRETLRGRIDELSGEIDMKRRQLEELTVEMKTLDIEPASADLDLPSVADAERASTQIERKLQNLGNVNMLSIEQYDEAEERLGRIAEDYKKLRKNREDLIQLAEQLEGERKERLTTVLEVVSENFKRVYSRLSDGGNSELRLENPKDPFTGGLEMWCQPRGKSNKSKLSLLSGGEKSMAALALIFAIQDYDPSPFYYFDEVDQNLDAYNAEHIARLCKIRSQRAQFIQVTLRKVSLQLADHHIGITHAGDGCSRQITDFGRDAAIELGTAALEELEAQQAAQANRDAAVIDLPDPGDMATVPDAIEAPASLGGSTLLDGVETSTDSEEVTVEGEASEEEEGDDSTLTSLASRADDDRVDMEEKLDVELAIEAADRDELDTRIAEEEADEAETAAVIEVEEVNEEDE